MQSTKLILIFLAASAFTFGCASPSPEVRVEVSDESLLKSMSTPAYPEKAAKTCTTGDVRVTFDIAKDGTTKNIRVISAASEEFARSAVEATERLVYKPPVSNGVPVEVRGVENTFKFRIEGDGEC